MSMETKQNALQVKIMNRSKNDFPAYATPSSAGMDLRANLDAPIVLKARGRIIVPTGIYIELPNGFEAQIRPRSGLAAQNGITVLNSPGTIDADYRGEIKIILANLSDEDFTIQHGDRIAQMVVARHETVKWIPADSLTDSERGEGGFGHTGNL